MKQYLLGIDIGTSATKTLLVGEDGEPAAQASIEYPLWEPGNGWAEQDPLDWKQAVFSTVKQVMEMSGVRPEAVRGIGLSGQMHGLVMLDGDGNPIRRSIIWCDQRSAAQVDEMLKIMPREKWMEITGNPPIAAWTAAKLLWVRKEEPEVWKQCRHILLPKDYIRYCLTGEFATDVSDASGMQLLDIRSRQWSDEVLKALSIDRNLLGTVYESVEITGKLQPDAAKKLGLTASACVVGGAADNAAAAVGTGVVENGEAFTTIGTSALVYTHLDRFVPVPGGGLHLCCCAVPGGYFTMGGPQAAGLSLEWFKEHYCGELKERAVREGRDIYSLINEEAAKIPAGSERLIYLPYLMGERTPHMNPRCRAAFIGLTAIHKAPHLLRAIMEGIAYSLADCNDIVREMGNAASSMKICGGGSKSRLWRQILADLYGCDIKSLIHEEGPAYGAAILAGAGTGVFEDIVSACRRFIKTGETIKPVREEQELYRKYHALYGRMYAHLTEDFDMLYEL